MHRSAEPEAPLSLRILSAEDVRQAVSMRDAIAVMREAFVQLSGGSATVPKRQVLPLAAHHGRALFMPAYMPGQDWVGLKAVTIHDDNPARGYPYIHALVLLFDATIGRPVALMDGEYLTALRTGAASGLATVLLARPEARVAAVFGAGSQAMTQVEAVCAVRPIEEVLLFNRTAERAERLADALRVLLDADVHVASSARALRRADVICTATSAMTPVFRHEDLRPGVHINAIGAYRPDMAEVPPETVQAARVIVDHRASCLAEAGDLIQPLKQGLIDEEHLQAELGEVAAQQAAGRTHADQVTLFKSVGNAIQDVAVAGRIVEVAQAQDLGHRVWL